MLIYNGWRYRSTPTLGETKINLNGAGSPSGLTDWNDFNKEVAFVPLALHDDAGNATTYTIVATGFTPDAYGPSSPGSDAYFPTIVMSSQQYVGGGNPYACLISGLNPLKTYYFRIAIQCAGAGNVDITMPGYSTVTVAGGFFTDTYYAAVTPSGGGTIAISTLGVTNYSAINGIIFKEN